jgi:DNA-binding FrmR family transcriptional regulator
MRLLINLMALNEEFDEIQRQAGHSTPETATWASGAIDAYRAKGYVAMHEYVQACLADHIVDPIRADYLAHEYCETVVEQIDRCRQRMPGAALELAYYPASMDLVLRFTKAPPPPTPQQRLRHALSEAEENGDYLPESMRRAIAALERL